MISEVDGSRILIRRDSDGRFYLTCYSCQIAVLREIWGAHDYSPFEVRDDVVVQREMEFGVARTSERPPCSDV